MSHTDKWMETTITALNERMPVTELCELVLDFVEVPILTNDLTLPWTEWKSHENQDTCWKVRRLRSFQDRFLGLELDLFEYAFRQRDFSSWCEALVQWLPDNKRLVAYALPNPEFLHVTEWARARFPHYTLADLPWYPLHQKLWSELRRLHSPDAKKLWTHLFEKWHFVLSRHLFGFDVTDAEKVQLVCMPEEQRNILNSKVPEGGLAGFHNSNFCRMVKSNKWDMCDFFLYILESAALWFLQLLQTHGQHTCLYAEAIIDIVQNQTDAENACIIRVFMSWFLDFGPSDDQKRRMLAVCRSTKAYLLLLASLPKRPYFTRDRDRDRDSKEGKDALPYLLGGQIRRPHDATEPLSHEEQDLLCRFYWQDWIATDQRLSIPHFVADAICQGLIPYERVDPNQWFGIQFCLLVHGEKIDRAFVETKEDIFSKGGNTLTSDWTLFWKSVLDGSIPTHVHHRSFKRMAAVKRIDADNPIWRKPWMWSSSLAEQLSADFIHVLFDIGLWPSDIEGSILFLRLWAEEIIHQNAPALSWRNLFFSIYVVRSRWNFYLDNETATKIGWKISIPKNIPETMRLSGNSRSLHLLQLSNICVSYC